MSIVKSKCTPVCIALNFVKIYAVTYDEAVFNSVLYHKVQVKIKPYKAIVKCSKSQTI